LKSSTLFRPFPVQISLQSIAKLQTSLTGHSPVAI
jgi:hypothetical protein